MFCGSLAKYHFKQRAPYLYEEKDERELVFTAKYVPEYCVYGHYLIESLQQPCKTVITTSILLMR